MPDLPTAVIIGRTNVGKSTLFNRLIEKSQAITSSVPGTTRDNNRATMEWRGINFNLIDTGGFDINPASEVEQNIHKHIKRAVQNAEVILVMVDGQVDPTPLDRQSARTALATKRPAILVINKIDSTQKERRCSPDYYKLGLPETAMVSGLNGRSSGDLLDLMVAHMKKTAAPEPKPDAIRLALIGRPNVGKSSLFNHLLGEERSIVASTPYTTRESHDEILRSGGRDYCLIDTAGLRRSARIRNARGPESPLERESEAKTTLTIKQCDVAILMLDLSQTVSAQDKKLAQTINDLHKGLIVVANKADLVPKEGRTAAAISEVIRGSLPFLDWASVLPLSAKSGWNANRLLPMAGLVYDSTRRWVDSAALTEITDSFQRKQAAPLVTAKKTHKAKLTMHQTGIEPPTFLIRSNLPGSLPQFYYRYIEHTLRAHFDFTGAPLQFNFTQYKGRK